MRATPEEARESPETVYQLATGRRCDLRFWKRKLFSSEDPQYIHKTLGFLCICSFAYRYHLLFFHGSLGIRSDLPSFLTMILHFLLSCSSLIFHVLAKRIISRPMIIWEEYRLHAIVFTTRCMSLFVYSVVRRHFNFSGTFEPFVLFGLIMAHHVAADAVTHRYGSGGAYTTVRIQDKQTLFSKLVLRFYAFYQFSAIASHLVPSETLGDMAFNTLVAIQSSAFLMTLYRKALVSWYTHGIFYTACLLMSFYGMATQLSLVVWAGIVAAFCLRVSLGANKYMIWLMFVCGVALANQLK